jgi:nitrate/TMAO reductase-like tetraheme cytochrome c subunit
MVKQQHVNKLPGLFLAVGILILASLLWYTPTRAREYAQETEQYCLSCHSNPDLDMTLPSGET